MMKVNYFTERDSGRIYRREWNEAEDEWGEEEEISPREASRLLERLENRLWEKDGE